MPIKKTESIRPGHAYSWLIYRTGNSLAMQNALKDWLVRTRSGEVLGPFSQRELFEELNRKTFTWDDEIAQSLGQWISAQTLANHETDEFTLTHTRNQTITKSVSSTFSKSFGGTDSNSEISFGPNFQPGDSPIAASRMGSSFTPTPLEPEELTPTPDAISPSPSRLGRKISEGSKTSYEVSSLPPRLAPLIVSVAVISCLWVLINNFRIHSKSAPEHTKSTQDADGANEGDSPFVRNIYTLIRTGETEAALKLLTQYNEKRPPKGDIEYLIPYAALLITTEEDAPSRARKYLEQVLTQAATPRMKARAHHWLGYLMLSEEEGDMGESHFLESLQLNPKDAAARFNLGVAYFKQKRYSQALDYLQLAELEVPDLWIIHIFKGRARAAMGNIEEAQTSFKRAVDVAPERWMTYLYYAAFLSSTGKNEAAQAIMRAMVTKDPQYETYSPIPLSYFKKKVTFSEYLEAFEATMGGTLSEEKELGKLYINYLINGPSSNEAKRIEAVAEKGSLMAKVFALKVALDRDAPAEKLKLVLKRLPSDLHDFGYYAYVLRGDARTRIGQYSDAQEDLLAALRLEPQSAIAQWTHIALLTKMQKPSDAQAETKSLLTYHPDYIPAVVSGHNY